MTTHVEDVMTGVGLLIDGGVEAGGNGTYPVTNPARPVEVVLEAPSTSAAQLDRAVEAARRSQPAWAALPAEERAARVVAAAEAGVAAVEGGDLARLLTPSTGRPRSSRSSTRRPWAAWPPPSRRWWPRRWRPAC